jgi:hypothetical protein
VTVLDRDGNPIVPGDVYVVAGPVRLEDGSDRVVMVRGDEVLPIEGLGGGSGAPADPQYLVGAAHAGLSAERVVTDTSSIAWDLGTAGQAKANVPNDSITAAMLHAASVLGALNTLYQALHANLTAFAGLSLIADRLPYANGTGTLALATFTSFARALLNDTTEAEGRATLGVESIATTADATTTGTLLEWRDGAWNPIDPPPDTATHYLANDGVGDPCYWSPA